MTDKPTPTDAEILDAAEDFRSQYTHGGTTFDEFDEIGFARAVLAKWGTPAPVGVGEVAERYRNAIASACEGWTMPDGLRKHLETALWSPPTPQPTQAQATEPVAWLDPWTGTKVTTDYDAYGKHGIPLYTAPQPVAREPLTPEQIAEMMRDTWGCASIAPRHAPEFARAVQRAHGITKGGQHGTE